MFNIICTITWEEIHLVGGRVNPGVRGKSSFLRPHLCNGQIVPHEHLPPSAPASPQWWWIQWVEAPPSKAQSQMAGTPRWQQTVFHPANIIGSGGLDSIIWQNAKFYETYLQCSTFYTMPDGQLRCPRQPSFLCWAAPLQPGLPSLLGRASEEEQDLPWAGLQHLLRVRNLSVEAAQSKNCCKLPPRSHRRPPPSSLCAASHQRQTHEHDLNPNKQSKFINVEEVQKNVERLK